jgi:hypothetical protein
VKIRRGIEEGLEAEEGPKKTGNSRRREKSRLRIIGEEERSLNKEKTGD